jgi:C-terminal peptidase prc
MQAFLVLAGLLPTAPVPATPAPPVYIVIAGISAYSDREIPSRPHAEEDARALHDLLADRRYLGAGKDQMRLLLGKAVTRRSLLESMEWLRDRAGPDDLVLFAFFGQGATLGERGDRICYLTADSTLAGRMRNSVSAGEIADIFERLKSRRVCVLLDVPFTGFRTGRSIAQPLYDSEVYREFNGGLETVDANPLPGRLLVARPGRFGPELLAGLRGAADTGEGIVTSANLASYLRKRLSEKKPEILIAHGESAPFPLVLNPAVCRKQVVPGPLEHEQVERYVNSLLELCRIIEEEHIHPPDIATLLRFGIEGLYQRLREPLPREVVQELQKLKNASKQEQQRVLSQIRLQLGGRKELAEDSDLIWTGQEMLARFDRGSSFVFRDIVCEYRGQFYGIGLSLRKSAATDLLEVVTPILGSPAQKAGVMTGDVISAITNLTDHDGRPLDAPETWSTEGLPMKKCGWLLEGKKGTTVRLTIQRPGEDRPRTIEAARESVNLATVVGRRRKRDGCWDYWLDEKKKIGYLCISYFNARTPGEVKGVVQQLRQAGVKGLVLDLRFNPGGLILAGTEVTALFLDMDLAKNRPIVTLKARKEQQEVFGGGPGKALPGVPLIVLLNSESASSSEIMVACLQDNKRAVIVGERSRGKGSVWLMTKVRGIELQLTEAVFLRPSGKCLNRFTDADTDWGVQPDVLVPLTRQAREELYQRMSTSLILPRPDRPLIDPYADFKDVQLEKAIDHLRRNLTQG